MKQKILLLNKVNLNVLNEATKIASDFCSKTTNGEFELEFTIQQTAQDFQIVKGQGNAGINEPVLLETHYLDPHEIAQAGRKAEIDSNTNFDVVGVVWEPPKDKIARPIHYPLTHEGFTIIELILPPGGTAEVLGNAIVHELLHADCYLTGFRDTVHAHSDIWDIRPEFNFADIVLKLKPYWPVLTKASRTIPAPSEADLRSTIERLTAIRDELLRKLAGKKSRIEAWAATIKIFEGYFPGSPSYRNNNPGNLKYAGQRGTSGMDNQGHAIFKTYQDGWNALIAQLKLAASGKSITFGNHAKKLGLKDSSELSLFQFFGKYAEANQVPYANFAAKQLGVTPETKIKTLL